MTKLLNTIVKELKKLSDTGMKIQIHNETINLKVFLGQVSGDNLGMYSLFGFVESFSANFLCRFCCVHKQQLQSLYAEDIALVRNGENYTTSLAVVMNSQDLQSHMGVVKPCHLNDLCYFHITQNVQT